MKLHILYTANYAYILDHGNLQKYDNSGHDIRIEKHKRNNYGWGLLAPINKVQKLYLELLGIKSHNIIFRHEIDLFIIDTPWFIYHLAYDYQCIRRFPLQTIFMDNDSMLDFITL